MQPALTNSVSEAICSWLLIPSVTSDYFASFSTLAGTPRLFLCAGKSLNGVKRERRVVAIRGVDMRGDQQGSSRPHFNNKEKVTEVSAGWRCERPGGHRQFRAAFGCNGEPNNWRTLPQQGPSYYGLFFHVQRINVPRASTCGH